MSGDGSPSVTAAVVASTLLLLQGDEELGHLVEESDLPGIERAVRMTLPVLGHALDIVPWPLLKWVAHGVERALSPGFVAHYALRKRAVREQIVAAVHDGFRQVVLVGAGFDMMSASLPDGVRIYEVDHPATQSAKRRSIVETQSHGATQKGHSGHSGRPEITFVPINLAHESLAQALSPAVVGFDSCISSDPGQSECSPTWLRWRRGLGSSLRW